MKTQANRTGQMRNSNSVNAYAIGLAKVVVKIILCVNQ